MQSGGVAGERLERAPKLAPDCDPSSLQITPVEGYLLSRIDGHTPWRLLREIGGLPPDDVDRCLDTWLADGVILLPEKEETQSSRAKASQSDSGESNDRTESAAAKGEASTEAGSKEGETPSDKEVDESLLDPELDLEIETQRKILAFETSLDRDYFALLDVGVEAEARDIKRAYFKLSKEFHPDRYFRRSIGDYGSRLDRIFKKVLEAYELLSDPVARAEIEKTLPAPASAVEEQVESTQADTTIRPLTPMERLRQRMPFKIPETMIAEKRDKARGFYTTAVEHERTNNLVEAASSMRLAIAFDPYNADYKTKFAEIRARGAEKLASQLIRETGDSPVFSDDSELKDALRMLEDVLLYRPHDPEVNASAAEVTLKLGNNKEAREYIDRAIEHSPDVAAYHVTSAKVYRKTLNKGHAVRELETALDMGCGDSEVRDMLAELRGIRRGSAGGGVR